MARRRWPLLRHPIARFWQKVDVHGPVIRPGLGACWMWLGAKYRHGYGNVSIGDKNTQAHRYSWSLINGRIPHGKVICHRCDNPPCVNPAHLFVGSQKDNQRDMARKGRAPMPLGMKNVNAKFTDDEVRLIRRQANGKNYALLAARYGVHQSTISRIARGLSWPHVADVVAAEVAA